MFNNFNSTNGDWNVPTDRKSYEDNLKERQKKHLKQIHWKPCLHDNCPECVGTGIKKDGSKCYHYLSCPCPKCTPTY